MSPEERPGTPLPPLALTLGDPRGIGPEVVEAAVRSFLSEQPDVRFSLFGDDEALSRLSFDGTNRVERVRVARFDGTVESAGAVSIASIRAGVQLCLEGRARGLVTGPVHKPALHAAGTMVPGQTELLRDLTGAPAVGMLMAAESTRMGCPLRILLATTHLALRDVPDRLTRTGIETQVRLLREALRDRWNIAEPRIALCALNPHASDGGLFGNEEAAVLTPAVESLRAEGLRVDGPFPADTVFLRLLDRTADAVVVPYHDVGMAVFKTLAFGRGVNVTIGLPFIRTSPDHGTAFDIAGEGRADATSTLEALRLADRLSRGHSHGRS